MSDAKNKPSLSTETMVEAATFEVEKLENEMEELNRNLAKLSLDMVVVKDLKKIHENIVTVNQNLNGIRNIMEQQLKRQHWPFVPADILIGESKMFPYWVGSEKFLASELVKQILKAFTQTNGFCLPKEAYIMNYNNKIGRDAFIAAIKSEVKNLIGHEPRLDEEPNGRGIAIYYT